MAMQVTTAVIEKLPPTWDLIDQINPKLHRDFGFRISVEGFDDLQGELGSVLDFDLDELRDLNKSVTLWASHLTDTIGCLEIAIGQYKNMLDIYEHLDSIAIKDPDDFQRTAPKYKIDSRNIPIAIKTVAERKGELSGFVKRLKVLASALEACRDYMTANYYKTAALIASSTSRAFNTAF